MAYLITVTGATGHNGKAIAERLLQLGVNVRAVARNAGKLASLAAKGADVHIGDLGDTVFLTEAFRSADAVFAMIPQHFDAPDYQADQRRMVASMTEALEAAGVSHVVALSTPAARLRTGLPAILAEFEERLSAMPGLSVVVLQPMYYMENHLASIFMIRNTGSTGGAIRGDVALPMIATRDVAAVAVEYLLAPTFAGYTERPLLGPRDYTFREASSILGAVIGKPDLPYVEFSYDDFREGLSGAGFSASAADAFVEMTRAMNDGRIRSGVSRDASNTTPTTLEVFAREVFAPAYRHVETGAVP